MINYRNVTIQRGDNVLIDNFSLHVGEGEFVYLLGKVGSGKSSLLKTMYSDLDIQKGEEAMIFGQYDLLNLRSGQVPYLRRKLGIIFQDFQLLTDRSVEANLDFVLRATGWKKSEERRQRIAEVLQMVGMEDHASRMPNTLSGGEQQRVVIARAFLNQPSLILADEPTANLDQETGMHIVGLLYQLCKEHNTSVIMATHNVQYIQAFKGRVLRLLDRQLTEVGGDDGEDSVKSFMDESNPDMLEGLEGIPSTSSQD